MSIATQLVLEPREFRLLDGLRLNPRKSFQGRVRGERLTTKKGISIEFADYREYSEGDDLRHLDWNVLARLGVPVTKTYRDEEDLAVHILLDCSASMSFGEPDKMSQARRLACALGYVALNAGDAVYPRKLGKRERPVPALRGRSAYARLASWASAAEPDGTQDLAVSLRAFAASDARPGLAILLSDGMTPEVAGAVKTIVGRGHDVMFLQVLSDVELDPDLEGDLKLIDAEEGSPIEITVNSFALKEYRERLSAHNAALSEAARRGGGRYALIQPTEPFEAVLRNVLKREGWVTS